MLAIEVRTLRFALVGHGLQQAVLQQPERPMVGLAQPPARLDDLVEHRLQPGCARHCTKHGADRSLLRAQSFHPAGELVGVGPAVHRRW